MTEDNVARMMPSFSMDSRGFLRVELDPEYELLAEYLGSEMLGLNSDGYMDARAAIELARRGEVPDEIVGGGCLLVVAPDVTRIEMLYQTNRSLTIATDDFAAALDAYEAFAKS